jgi:hypothetical protein
MKFHLKRRRSTPHPDCIEGDSCAWVNRVGHRLHGACADCGAITCERSLRIQPDLSRRVVPVCNSCRLSPNRRQSKLASERSRNDWLHVTDPIATGLLKPGVMPEQLPGPTRAALRAFYESSEMTAVVAGVGAETLNQSIATLGLGASMYAETRDKQTVLRRTGAKVSP